MAAAIELHHDENGILWPLAIAPFQATVLTLGPEPELAEGGGRARGGARGRRASRCSTTTATSAPGVKFKDADLVGIPIRIAVGKKGLAEGKAEWKLRGSKQVELVPLGEVAAKAAEAVRGAGRAEPRAVRAPAGGSRASRPPARLGASSRRWCVAREADRRARRTRSRCRRARRSRSASPAAASVDFVTARGACALLVPARADAAARLVRGLARRAHRPGGGAVRLLVAEERRPPPLVRRRRRAARGAARELRRKSIYFKDGQVVFASSSDPQDRLGPVLAARRVVRPPELERCSRLVKSGRPARAGARGRGRPHLRPALRGDHRSR